MNKKRKEHKSLALAILTTITVVFTISPSIFATDDNGGMGTYEDERAVVSTEQTFECDETMCFDVIRETLANGSNSEVKVEASAENEAIYRKQIEEDNYRPTLPASSTDSPEPTGWVNKRNSDDTQHNDGNNSNVEHDGTVNMAPVGYSKQGECTVVGDTCITNQNGLATRPDKIMELTSERDSANIKKDGSDDGANNEFPTDENEPTTSLENSTTHSSTPSESDLASFPTKPNTVSIPTKWLDKPPKNPDWYNQGITQKNELQSEVESRDVFRGTENFVQCTGNTTYAWDDLVTKHVGEDDKWKTRFAKLYEDFILSKSTIGLYKDIDDDEVDQFIIDSQNTECIVSAKGAEGPYFINNNFKINKTYNIVDNNSLGKIIECSALGCAKNYLNNDESRLLHGDMMNINSHARIKVSKVKEHMEAVAENAREALMRGKDLYEKLKACEVFAASTSDFEHYKDEHYNNKNEKVSYDKKLTCYSVGVQTQDYPACAAGIVAYDSIFTARIVMDEAQKLDYMGHTMDAQSKMTQSIGGDVTAALKLQKESLKKQAQMQGQKAAAETAALAVLLGYRKSMPTRESLIKDCSNIAKADSFENLHTYYSDYTKKIMDKLKVYHERNYIVLVDSKNTDNDTKTKIFSNSDCGGSDISYVAPNITWDDTVLQLTNNNELKQKHLDDPEKVKNNACEEYVLMGRNSLAVNEEARDGMKQAAIQVGVQIAAYAGKASLLNKQAGKIGSAISQVDAFQPVGVSFDSGVASVTDCFKNPEAEGCKVNNDGTIDFYDGSIDLSGGGGAATISGGSGDDSSARESDSDTGANGDNINIPIGSVIASVNKAKGDFESSPAGALGMKKTGAGGGGGGGGGGAGSVAPPGGGSGSRGGGGGGSRYRGSKSKVSYSAGGGSLRYSSGSRGRKKSKSSNPFSKLFGKKKGKGGVLNFRGTASGKQISGENGNLFNMISQRYGVVTQKKRLQEYESVK